MGNGIGKILYFWIFILGGLFVAKVLGFIGDSKTLITFLVAIALIYIVFNVFRSLGRKKRAEKEEANKPPVRKGQSTKKKRK
jgi:hypothetical protein